jgi:adenosylmethionine-8-amino-7-oxononanoate aminotransferase
MAAHVQEHLFYQSARRMPFVQRAQGVYLWDEAGKEYIDGCSGAIISNIGHGHPRIAEAIARQAQSAFFAYRLHFENRPAARLAETLARLSADHLQRVFFVSGGSEAVETAMKLCRQYFYCQGEGSRHLFISRRPSYHGCTLGALGLTGYAPLEAPFRPMIQAYPKIPAPFCYHCPYGLRHPGCDLACARALETEIRSLGEKNVAAFVAEPIGGASTGAVVPPEGYFDVIQAVCRKYGVMLILDEVMTGFGRTGTLFAYQHWNIRADLVAISKGMASGYFPLGAVMTTEPIVSAVLDKGGFAHGHTYAGNPMACAVGLEVLGIIQEEHLCENARHMGHRLRDGLKELALRHLIIGDVRGKGLLLAIELVEDRASARPFDPLCNAAQLLTDIAYDQGLIIYPRRCIDGLAGDHVLVAPPLCVTAAEVDEILHRLDLSLFKTAAHLAEHSPPGSASGRVQSRAVDHDR